MHKQPWFWALCVAVVVVAIVVTVNLTVHSNGKKHTIIYSISGTVQGATIFYFDASQNDQKVTDPGLPWSKTITVTGDPSRFRVGAFMRQNSAHHKLACTLSIDGKVAAHKSTRAQNAEVHCNPK